VLQEQERMVPAITPMLDAALSTGIFSLGNIFNSLDRARRGATAAGLHVPWVGWAGICTAWGWGPDVC